MSIEQMPLNPADQINAPNTAALEQIQASMNVAPETADFMYQSLDTEYLHGTGMHMHTISQSGEAIDWESTKSVIDSIGSAQQDYHGMEAAKRELYLTTYTDKINQVYMNGLGGPSIEEPYKSERYASIDSGSLEIPSNINTPELKDAFMQYTRKVMLSNLLQWEPTRNAYEQARETGPPPELITRQDQTEGQSTVAKQTVEYMNAAGTKREKMEIAVAYDANGMETGYHILRS